MEEDRDTQIAEAYVAGSTLQELADQHKVTRSRIQQILRKAGITKLDRHTEEAPPDIFLGVNVPEEVKEALRVEARLKGVSMSALTSETISDMLRERGYPLEAKQVSEAGGAESSLETKQVSEASEAKA